MRRARIVWAEVTFDRFLKNQLATVPGTAMGYDGVKDNAEWRALAKETKP